jgi:hypothetical protein
MPNHLSKGAIITPAALILPSSTRSPIPLDSSAQPENHAFAATGLLINSVMVSLAEFKEQAAALSVEQRASLASFLLHSLPEPDYDVSDEEVAERIRQMKSGEVSSISMDELRAGVFADRER